MHRLLLPLAIAALPAAAAAETTLIDTSKLPVRQVHDVAELTPLAVSPSGSPAVVLLDLDAGDVVPPHAAKSGLRLLTVLSGEMSWGDGNSIDESRETVYPAGSLLVVPAGLDHWLAARGGDVRVQLVVLDDETPVPAMLEQMQ
ncbi:cupin domain-containing protein [Pelagibius sp.]|uniref:cupin domain-containing protein n=1 Tax=Pelagibius sp. TaxID=1931238 RepID=UPI003BB00312